MPPRTLLRHPAVEITAAVISVAILSIILVVVRVAARKTWRRGSDESFRGAVPTGKHTRLHPVGL